MTRNEPLNGDVLITSDASGFLVSLFPNRHFIRFKHAEDAVGLAQMWAVRNRVAAWRAVDGMRFVPITVSDEDKIA